MSHKENQGFTLIEILLVVAAIVILAGIVIVAINPGKQLADTRNAEREANVNAIIDAVQQYAIDNNGNLPSSIPTSGTCGDSGTEICETGVASSSCSSSSLVDLSVLTDNGTYLNSIPRDPQDTGTTSTSTNYAIVASSANDRITVCAPDAEQGDTISVTK